MSEILFIRHAKTDMAGLFCGHSDPALNELGRKQVLALRQKLATEQIVRVYSSDLRRAQDTAEAIADDKKISLTLRPLLREIDFGAWEGLSWQQIEARDAAYAQKWLAAFPELPAPSGESFSDFQSRILNDLDELLDGQNGTIAVVTHAGVLRVVQQQLLGSTDPWKDNQPYCGILRCTCSERFLVAGRGKQVPPLGAPCGSLRSG